MFCKTKVRFSNTNEGLFTTVHYVNVKIGRDVFFTWPALFTAERRDEVTGWVMDARRLQVDTKRQLVMAGFVISTDNYTDNVPAVVRSANSKT